MIMNMKLRLIKVCPKILFALLFSSIMIGYQNAAAFEVEELQSELGIPWGMSFIDDNKLIVTDKTGRVFLLDLKEGSKKQLDGLPSIEVIGQGGLLDVAKSPDFENTRELYFTYAKPVETKSWLWKKSKNYATALAVATLSESSLENWKDLFISNVVTKNGRHFGSRMAFDGNGHIFVTHGDRGDREQSQNLSNHAGTVIRLNLDGSIPEDNPFVSDKDALPEIWSYGHRNPQGIFYDATTGQLWVNEHGPRGGDELNLVVKGVNYGWPTISYGREYVSRMQVGIGTEKAGLEQPKKYFTPSIAPSSLIIYQGDKFPDYKKHFFAGSLALTHLNLLSFDESGELIETRMLQDLTKRIRNVIESPDGSIIISTDDGRIYRLS